MYQIIYDFYSEWDGCSHTQNEAHDTWKEADEALASLRKTPECSNISLVQIEAWED